MVIGKDIDSIGMFCLLLLLWIIFNANFTVEILLFGIIISAAVCLFAVKFLGYSFKEEFRYIKRIPALLLYIVILILEIIKANLQVIRLICRGNKAIHPAICHFHIDLKTKLARTILANSITLTPGTITVSMHDNEYYVHCLDKSLADGITDSVFVRRLKKMEEGL